MVGGNAAARTYRQNIFFCGDALEYVNVELTQFESAPAKKAERDAETGVAVRYLKDFDITESTEVERLDIFFGVKNVYPEIGIRHIGARVQ